MSFQTQYNLGLLCLPLEVCEVIFLYSESDSLKQSCSFFRNLYQNPSFQTKMVLCRYSIWQPSYNIFTDGSRQQRVQRDQWIALIESGELSERLAMQIFHIGLVDSPQFVPIAAEYAIREDYCSLLHDLLIHAPRSVIPERTEENDEGRISFMTRGLNQLTRDQCLVQAALCGHERQLELLLQFDARVEYDDYAALKMAAKYGHTKCVAILLQSRSQLDADDNYALCWAARGDHFETVQLLLDAGADINARHGTPLRWASEYGAIKVVTFLLKRGAEVHYQDDYALRWSALRGHVDIVKMLLDHGADVHAVQDFPIRNAIKFGHLDVVSLLLQYGADPCASNKEAINWVIQQNNQDMLKLLTDWVPALSERATPSSISVSDESISLRSLLFQSI